MDMGGRWLKQPLEAVHDTEDIDLQLIGTCNDAVKRGIKGWRVATRCQDRDFWAGPAS